MRFILSLLLLASMALIPGCGTTEESREEEEVSTPEPPAVPAVSRPADPPVSFDARTDTVLAAPPVVLNEPVVNQRAPAIQYLVQLGAFKDAGKATHFQNAARDRLKMTVLNDYNTLIGMYQIRVGYFESREAAAAFRDTITRDYPEEYKGSWIVQLVR